LRKNPQHPTKETSFLLTKKNPAE